MWEENDDFGQCYSMVTTEPGEVAARIHDRMPALLAESKLERYRIRPSDEIGEIPCESPLKMREPGLPIPVEVQQDLF